MKTPFYVNAQAIESDLIKIQEALTIHQEILKEYVSLQLPIQVKSLDNLIELIEGGESWIKSQLEANLPKATFLGIQIRPSKAVELMDLPSFDRINTLAEECKPTLHFLHFFQFNGGALTLQPGYEHKISERHTVYAESRLQETLLKAHANAATAITAFNKAINEAGLDRIYGDSVLSEYFDFQYSSTWVPSGSSLEAQASTNFHKKAMYILFK